LQTEQQLLDEYKKYDYLNADKNNPLVKIFVSYIKPSFLFKSEVLTPIHLGRAVEKDNSKNGKISDEDIAWLHQNCIGDDDFEGNISNVNRRVGFLTGTYWAWKNYEKLGNPKYFGSFGYRRLLKADCLDDIIKFDCIIPPMVDFSKTGPTIKEHVSKLQGENTLTIMINTMQKICPNEITLFMEYLNFTKGYLYEIYILKKDLFFDFCEWIFPILFELLNISPKKYAFIDNKTISAEFVQKTNEIRDIAYIVEILTGFYCYKLHINKKIQTKTALISHILTKEQKNNRLSLIANIIREKAKYKK
jgi:hypothetical protein